VPVAVRLTGYRPDGAAMDFSDGTFADLIVLRLIGQGHSPGPEGDYVSLAMRPGTIVLAPIACARNNTSATRAGHVRRQSDHGNRESFERGAVAVEAVA
jgi:hypothetical protein